MITAKSYFSGAGGMDLGIQEAGIDILESYEIDEKCCNTLERNFSHKINNVLGQVILAKRMGKNRIIADITKITVLDQQDADVYIGTFPCTKYSIAADINGTRTGDDLFLHFFRHIALAQPEMYVVENVPGMLKFKVVMEALTQLPDYYVRIECPIDANMWLPQNRKRLILIGSKKPFNNFEYPTQKRIKLKEIIEKNRNLNAKYHIFLENNRH